MKGDFESQAFGRYLLIQRIAIGGFSEVFLAHDPKQGEGHIAVVKRLNDQWKDSDACRHSLSDEARILSRLSHPNIVQLHHKGTADGRPYIVIEHVWGETVNALVGICNSLEQPFPAAAAIYIGIEIAGALEHAHVLKDDTGFPSPVIHRDVTARNVMVTADGRVKILDFGIAKDRERLARTKVGAVKGTLTYLAPEQLKQRRVGPHTDIYQLGVLLYKMLVGQAPVAGLLVPEVFWNISHGKIIRPSKVIASFPQDIEEVLLKALARKPSARYSSAAEFGAALSQVGGQQIQGQMILEALYKVFAGQREHSKKVHVAQLLDGLEGDDTVARLLAQQDNEPDTIIVELSAFSARTDSGEFSNQTTLVTADPFLRQLVERTTTSTIPGIPNSVFEGHCEDSGPIDDEVFLNRAWDAPPDTDGEDEVGDTVYDPSTDTEREIGRAPPGAAEIEMTQPCAPVVISKVLQRDEDSGRLADPGGTFLERTETDVCPSSNSDIHTRDDD